MGYHDTSFDASFESLRLRGRAYGHAAFAAAIGDGLMPEEVHEVLAGRRIIDAFPVQRGESLPAYAERTVAEMMVAYLRQDPGGSAALHAARA